MRSEGFSNFYTYRDQIYSKLNNFSTEHPISGRACAIPAGVLDVGIDLVRYPLSAIKSIAMAALNLVGCFFSDKCKLRDGLAEAEIALDNIAMIPVRLAMAPFKILFQIGAGLVDPARVKIYSTSYYAVTFADRKKPVEYQPRPV